MSKLDISDAKVKKAFDDVTNGETTYALAKHEGTTSTLILSMN